MEKPVAKEAALLETQACAKQYASKKGEGFWGENGAD